MSTVFGLSVISLSWLSDIQGMCDSLLTALHSSNQSSNYPNSVDKISHKWNQNLLFSTENGLDLKLKT